jgi:hypothetical protein
MGARHQIRRVRRVGVWGIIVGPVQTCSQLPSICYTQFHELIFLMDSRESTPEDIRELKDLNKERLRNAFDDIIGKYAHDFSTVGDEIDLETGEIVVNNGHLRRMRDEQDVGSTPAPTFLRDWAKDVRETTPYPGDVGQPSGPEDDGWEDVDEEEMDLDGIDSANEEGDALFDELASEDMTPSPVWPISQAEHS